MNKISAKVVVKNLRVSTRKLNLLLSHIRGQNVNLAKDRMSFSRKIVAKSVFKALNTCIDDMQNNKGVTNFNSCIVKEAYVGKGITLKRFMPRAKGRATKIRKVYSHMTIIIEQGE